METAIALVCRDRYTGCVCDWCYKMSTNGFHMKNQGQCKCWQTKCPCIEAKR